MGSSTHKFLGLNPSLTVTLREGSDGDRRGAGGKVRTTWRMDGLFGSSSSAISVVNTAINMPSFVAPPLTNLCETRYASKKAEEKQCGGRRPGENCSVSI